MQVTVNSYAAPALDQVDNLLRVYSAQPSLGVPAPGLAGAYFGIQYQDQGDITIVAKAGGKGTQVAISVFTKGKGPDPGGLADFKTLDARGALVSLAKFVLSVT